MDGKLFLVRHGETYWNKNKIMHGQYDIPLDDTGIKQAKNLAVELKDCKFDVCFCSPLTRAKQTANEILKFHRSVKIIYDDRLKEICKGKLEGTRNIRETILAKDDEQVLKKYNVESKSDFYLRVRQFIEYVTAAYRGKNVLIVCHSGTVKMALFNVDAYAGYVDDAYKNLHVKNCSCTVVDNKFNTEKMMLRVNPSDYNSKLSKEVRSMRIGVYPMVADILHAGHLTAIELAKKECDYLIVALHCKPSYKTTVQSIFERYMQLRAVKWVDEVIPYEDEKDAEAMLSSLDYDVYFLGSDHEDEDWQCKDLVKSLGKDIVYLPRNHCFSSTELKQRISDTGQV